MLGLHVTSEVDLSLEGSVAEGTWERLEAGVLPRVRDEVGGLAEGLAALTANIWLLTW